MLHGRSALITGGASGIGLATAKVLAGNGAEVALADVHSPRRELPQHIRHFNTDLRRQDDVDQLRESLDGPVDILILSAGLGVHQKMGEGDPDKWQNALDVNVMGALRVIRAFTPAMQHQEHGGDVVILSSVAAERQYEWGGVYSASKAALGAIAETLRLELQPKVRVTNILPGVVDTPFFQNMIGGGPTVKSIGWSALAADDVAEAVHWVLTRPRHVAVNTLVMRPAAQVL